MGNRTKCSALVLIWKCLILSFQLKIRILVSSGKEFISLCCSVHTYYAKEEVFSSSENNLCMAHHLAVVLNYSCSSVGHENALETLEHFLLNSPFFLT